MNTTVSDESRTGVDEALLAWEEKGPTSLTVALVVDALYGAHDQLAAIRAIANQHDDYCCTGGCTGPGTCASGPSDLIVETMKCREVCNCSSAPYLAALGEGAPEAVTKAPKRFPTLTQAQRRQLASREPVPTFKRPPGLEPLARASK